MKYRTSIRVLICNICLLVLLNNYLLPSVALAQTGKPAGQLSFARLVSVNNSNAAAGQTIFSGNWLKVAKQGTAIVNVGKMGRMEMGAGTDFVMRTSDNEIGGELNSGCMLISAPAGVSIALNTSKGMITTDGKQSASLFVGYKGGTANVIPNLGEIKVISGNRTESFKPGEWTSLSADTTGGSKFLRRLAKECAAPGIMCACSSDNLPNTNNSTANANSSRPAPTQSSSGGNLLPLVFGAFMVGTAGIFFLTFRDNVTGNNNTLTCVDTSGGILCRRVSPTNPANRNR